jgi:hypothetical protein
MCAVVVRLWYCLPVHVRHDYAQILGDCTIEITNPFCLSPFSESFSIDKSSTPRISLSKLRWVTFQRESLF